MIMSTVAHSPLAPGFGLTNHSDRSELRCYPSRCSWKSILVVLQYIALNVTFRYIE